MLYIERENRYASNVTKYEGVYSFGGMNQYNEIREGLNYFKFDHFRHIMASH